MSPGQELDHLADRVGDQAHDHRLALELGLHDHDAGPLGHRARWQTEANRQVHDRHHAAAEVDHPADEARRRGTRVTVSYSRISRTLSTQMPYSSSPTEKVRYGRQLGRLLWLAMSPCPRRPGSRDRRRREPLVAPGSGRRARPTSGDIQAALAERLVGPGTPAKSLRRLRRPGRRPRAARGPGPAPPSPRRSRPAPPPPRRCAGSPGPRGPWPC